MLKNLTYKKKNRLLAAALVLFAWVIYSYAISDTVAAWKACSEMEERTAKAAGAPVQNAVLRKQLEEMDRLIGSGAYAGGDVQQALLGIASAWCQEKGVLLREFPQTIFSEEKDLRIETNVFTVEGDFKKLLGLVYELEQKQKVGKLASVNFQMRKDPKTKTKNLTVTIYVQNVKKLNNELTINR